MFENFERDRVLLIKMFLTVENLVEVSKKEETATIEWRLRLDPG